MYTLNLILLIIGGFVTLIGIATFIHSNLARFINAPGGPRLKASTASIIGVLLITPYYNWVYN